MQSDTKSAAALYIVATPIGNLADLSERAIKVLSEVDIIACEDTRHTQKLLQHIGVRKPLISVHDHNERDRIEQIYEKLNQGLSFALVSDAGTPLISDPGYVLVSELRQRDILIKPVPGPSAVISALSVSGLPTNRFLFEGFLPHKLSGRRERIESVCHERATLVFYESKHRLIETLDVMVDILGGERRAFVAREITKTFEQFFSGNLQHIIHQISAHDDHQKGEFVIVVEGQQTKQTASDVDQDRLFKRLLVELPPKKAASIMAELTGESKKTWYQQALSLTGKLST